jgi:putative nucleotidyltransferase with HDIG domain
VKSSHLRKLEQINKEVWVVLSLLAIAFLVNFTVTSGRMLLGLYTLPTLGSAYMYGRRHATLTAFASVLIVTLLGALNAGVFTGQASWSAATQQWPDIAAWGGILIVTAYLMGTLYDHKSAQLEELRQTYHSLLYILRHFTSNDKYTENHSYRVAVYASKIGEALELGPERLEDVRAAALLHDIGKLEISRELLYKAARLTEAEFHQMRDHVERGASVLEPVGGSLRRVIPIVLAHHERFDGSGYHAVGGTAIPLEARVIAVADTYDALTSDRPYRRAMPPFEVKDIIAKGAGADFDPAVVAGFLLAFRRGDMEIPTVVV